MAGVTDLFTQSINRLKQTAQQCSFNSEQLEIILIKYVKNASQFKHFKKITLEQEENVVKRVKKNHYSREMFSAELSAVFKLSLILML